MDGIIRGDENKDRILIPSESEDNLKSIHVARLHLSKKATFLSSQGPQNKSKSESSVFFDSIYYATPMTIILEFYFIVKSRLRRHSPSFGVRRKFLLHK
jgi:hypothetical protein